MGTVGDLMEVLETERGHDKLCLAGYRYNFQKSSKLDDGLWYYNCEARVSKSCRGRVHVRAGHLEAIVTEHNHAASHALTAVVRVKNQIKAGAAAGHQSTDDLVTGALDGLSEDAEVLAPVDDSLKRNAQRSSLRARNVPAAPQRLADFVVPNADADYDDAHPFLLRDEGDGAHRYLIFAAPGGLEALSIAHRVFSDGTCRTVPHIFRQLYTICAEMEGGRVVPTMYVLMNSQTRRTYEKLFRAIRELCPAFRPRSWLTDFEVAAMRAVRTVFHIRAKGCLYHMSQSVYRRVQADGLQAAYNAPDSRLSLWTRALSALSLVPTGRVRECFDALTHSPDFDRRAASVYEYFERTYIGRDVYGQMQPALFPPRTWSHFKACRRRCHAQKTNNFMEGYHNRLRNIMRDHPNVFTFIRTLKREARAQERKARLALAGDGVRRRHNQIRADRRIRSLCRRFEGRPDVVAHLHAVARHFHA